MKNSCMLKVPLWHTPPPHTHHIDGKLFFTVHMCMVFLKFIVYWIFFILLYNFFSYCFQSLPPATLLPSLVLALLLVLSHAFYNNIYILHSHHHHHHHGQLDFIASFIEKKKLNCKIYIFWWILKSFPSDIWSCLVLNPRMIFIDSYEKYDII